MRYYIYVHVYRVYVDARAVPSRGLAIAYVSAARRSRLKRRRRPASLRPFGDVARLSFD